jgi:EAL domain-containing protein (putative c-di-GMP-specific phosphodiesterase class I)
MFLKMIPSGTAWISRACRIFPASNLGLSVGAEVVETKATWYRLTADVCYFAQGYYLSRPIPADEI